jgi:hypothetical protein
VFLGLGLLAGQLWFRTGRLHLAKFVEFDRQAMPQGAFWPQFVEQLLGAIESVRLKAILKD